MEYQNKRGGKVVLQSIVMPISEFDHVEKGDALYAMELVLSLEKLTNEKLLNLHHVEDQSLSSSFFPFIVAEHDICSEISTLENAIELPKKNGDIGNLGERNKAVDFVMEMGWLLHRNESRSRLGNLNPNTEAFPLSRFKLLIEFSMDHDWCAVVKRLLDNLVSGTVSLGDPSSLTTTLAELGLLHKAVRRNSKPLVSLLLRYVPQIARVQ